MCRKFLYGMVFDPVIFSSKYLYLRNEMKIHKSYIKIVLFIALFILGEMKHLLHVCSIWNIHVLSSLWFKGISPNHCWSTIWLWCNFTLLSLVLFCLGLIEHLFLWFIPLVIFRNFANVISSNIFSSSFSQSAPFKMPHTWILFCLICELIPI